MKTSFLFLMFLCLSITTSAINPKYDSLFNSAPQENAENIIRYFNKHIIKTDSLTAAKEMVLLEQTSNKQGNAVTNKIIDGLRGIFYYHYVPEYRDSSIILLEKALAEISSQKEFQLTSARLTNVLGVYYYRALDYQLALEYILKSEYKFKTIGYENVENIDFYLYNISVVHFGFKQYEKARDFLRLSLTYLDTTDLRAMQAEYNMLGIIYTHLEKRDSAIHYLQIAKNYMMKGDSSNLSAALCNIGIQYLNTQRFELAKTNFNQAFKNAKKFNEPLNITSASIALSRTYFRLNKFDSSQFWVNKSDSLLKVNKIKVPGYLLELYKLKGNLYKELGKYSLASQFKDSTIYKMEELEEAKDLSKMVDLNVELIQAKHNAEIDLLETKAENERKTKLLVLIFSIIGIAFIAYLWYISIKKRKADKLRYAAEHKQDVEKIESFKKRLKDKNTLIESISTQIDSLKNKQRPSEEEQAYLQKLRDSIILTEDDWMDFKQSFDQVYPNFISDLSGKYPDLTQAEVRFMVLLKLGLSVKEMANALAILPESVRKTRLRLTKKLGLSTYKELNKRIKEL